jgi:hypothetical protein
MDKAQKRELRYRENFHPLTILLADEIAACLSGQGVIPYPNIDRIVKKHLLGIRCPLIDALRQIEAGAYANNGLAGDIARAALIDTGQLERTNR